MNAGVLGDVATVACGQAVCNQLKIHSSAIFDSPEYQMLRMLLNGLIRFNHRFNLVTLFLSSRHARPEGYDNLYSRWALHVNRLSPEGKAHIEGIYFRAHVTVLQFMASRSLCLKLVYLAYVLKSLGMRSVSAAKAKSRDAMARDIKLDRLERDVYYAQEYDCREGFAAA